MVSNTSLQDYKPRKYMQMYLQTRHVNKVPFRPKQDRY